MNELFYQLFLITIQRCSLILALSFTILPDELSILPVEFFCRKTSTIKLKKKQLSQNETTAFVFLLIDRFLLI